MVHAIQQVLRADLDEFLAISFSALDRNSSNGFWDPVNARFTHGALKYVASVPLILVGCISIGYLIQIRTRRVKLWPKWLSNIIDTPPDALRAVDNSKANKFHINSTSGLAITSILGVATQLVKILGGRHSVDVIVLLVTWLMLVCLIALKRPVRASSLLLLSFASICIVELILWLNEGYDPSVKFVPNVVSAFLAILGCIVILRMPMYDPRLSMDDISAPYSIPSRALRSPEDNLTLWQFLTVSWMVPLVSVGYTRQLHEADVWILSYQFLHRPLQEKFKELRGSLVVRLLVANGLDIFISCVTGLIGLLAQLSPPVVYQQLLRSMQNVSSPNSVTIKYAAMILAIRIIAAQSAALQMWFSRRAYERSRGEMITTLYQKTLSRKISLVGSGEIIDDPEEMAKRLSASKGKIFNLMRGDCYNVAQRFWEIAPLIQKPVGLVLSIVLIWKIVGWPCLLGMLTVIFAQGINALIVRYLYILEKRRRAITDAKLHRTSSLVEAIRHLRWYGWHDAWLQDIMKIRQRELNMRILTGLLSTLVGFTMFTVVAFYAYTKLAHKELTVDIAFPALQLFNVLKDNLREIPGLITVLLNASVAIDRLNKFLSEEDKPVDKAAPDEQLRFEKASFAWPGTSQPVLHDLDTNFLPGLTLVTGKVGSGKSALLNAVLGELDLVAGNLVCPEGSIAYCAQVPWLESKSIRDNILFALPYEETRYQQVVFSCALLADLAEFKDGDLTMIGENGIGLSGGQKARVALARAVYSRAKIVLLDDPLAALDRPTSAHIIRECIAGSLLENRTVLFVTHQPETFDTLGYQTISLDGGRATVQKHDHDSTVESQNTLASSDQQASDTKKERERGKSAPVDSFMTEEYRRKGGVKASVYWRYIKAGKLYWWGLLIVAMLLLRFAALFNLWFLKEWGEAYKTEDGGGDKTPLGFLQRLPRPDDDVGPWLLAFFFISLAEAVFSLLVDVSMLIISYAAGKKIFRHVLIRFCSSTFRFLDVTPVGRLMNRLVGDIDTVDGGIAQRLKSVAQLSIRWLAALFVIASATPAFLIFSFCLMAAFLAVFVRFLPTSQSLRRLEMVSLSPLMSDFGALLDGLLTVRAFGVEQRFQDRLLGVVDNFQGMDHFYWTLQTWIQYRFDIIAGTSGFLLVLIAIYTNVSPGLTAFTLVTSNQLIFATHRICKRYGQMQMDFVAVERVVELLDLEQEDPGSITPPASWPSQNDGISFTNVTVRYAPHLPPALSNVSFDIKPGAHVALIGRTGCGKTTLALSLLSTLAPENGIITLDGFDIGTVDKQILRSRVTFLAQEPVLFPGTLRENLDPIQEYSDDMCEAVLKRIGGDERRWSLATHIESRGANLSLGERQLVSLARALLRRSSVIIMDEATASVDSTTEAMVHDLIKSDLAGSIILTIAHRVDAIRGADWVVVLDKGQVVRQGLPDEILSDEETSRRLGEE